MIIFVAAHFSHKAEEKHRPLLEKAMYEIAEEFGSVVLVDVIRSVPDRPPLAENAFAVVRVLSEDRMRFERDKTIFDVKIELLSNSFTSPHRELLFSVHFNLPSLPEKFFIQHRSVLAKYSLDCRSIEIPEAPNDFIFHSLNAHFLSSLLEKENILSELKEYPSNWLNRLRIAFENGVFTVTWMNAGDLPRKNPERLQKLQQICRTAVVFYDELSKEHSSDRALEKLEQRPVVI